MSEIITVEYAPLPGKKSNWSWLEGCIGEVSKSNIQRAFGRTKWNDKRGRASEYNIRVRFPIAAPFANLCYYPNKPVHSSLERRLGASGILLSIKDIYPIRETPISNYERILLRREELNDIVQITNKKHYYYTHSLQELRNVIVPFLRDRFPESFVWRLESSSSRSVPKVFLQARIYGAGTLIRTHSDEFRGAVLVLYSRPVSKGKLYGYASEDVYIFANTDEYISYIDGEKIPRLRADDTIYKRITSNRLLITPRRLLSNRQEVEKLKELPEEFKPSDINNIPLEEYLPVSYFKEGKTELAAVIGYPKVKVWTTNNNS